MMDVVSADPVARVVGDLEPVEVRVLGCLVEKEATTPAAYPLTRNALRGACNQSTSRDPVVDYDHREVESALLSLRDRRLARAVRGPGDRVTKFRHALPEVFDLSSGELAVLALLMLRGPQTAGELRARTARQHAFDGVEEVEAVLAGLAARTPPLVLELPRGHGQKEPRWTHRLGRAGAAEGPGTAPGAGGGSTGAPPAGAAAMSVAATFVEGARAVVAALAQPAVAAAWTRPSVLGGHDVASLAGHLARGGVWLVGDCLDRGVPAGPPDVASAAEYLVEVVGGLTEQDHLAIRNRGAAVAAVGHEQLLRSARGRLAAIAERLAAEDPGRLVEVFGGLSMPLEDYLVTRVVEQVVHLDDLARSVDGVVVAVPEAGIRLAVRAGLAALRRRHGEQAALRALFRDGFAARTLPVL